MKQFEQQEAANWAFFVLPDEKQYCTLCETLLNNMFVSLGPFYHIPWHRHGSSFLQLYTTNPLDGPTVITGKPTNLKASVIAVKSGAPKLYFYITIKTEDEKGCIRIWTECTWTRLNKYSPLLAAALSDLHRKATDKRDRWLPCYQRHCKTKWAIQFAAI